MLQFDGEGGWTVEKLEDGKLKQMLSLEDEKTQLESQLTTIPAMQQRLQQICAVSSRFALFYNEVQQTSFQLAYQVCSSVL